VRIDGGHGAPEVSEPALEQQALLEEAAGVERRIGAATLIQGRAMRVAQVPCARLGRAARSIQSRTAISNLGRSYFIGTSRVERVRHKAQQMEAIEDQLRIRRRLFECRGLRALADSSSGRPSASSLK
jgi:hypothetical protein